MTADSSNTAAPLPPHATALPSAARVEPGSYPVHTATYPSNTLPIPSDLSPKEVAEQWTYHFLSALNPSFSSGGSHAPLKDLFFPESYWRDQLCLSWDFHIWHGPEKMVSFLENPGGKDADLKIVGLALDESAPHRAPQVEFLDYDEKIQCIRFWMRVETKLGSGVGIVRLLQDGEDKQWKAYTCLTTLRELRGYEEFTGMRRPTGAMHGHNPGRTNWQDRVNNLRDLEGGVEPVVLIVGSGQGGLTAAARLKQLGILALVIDQNERIGDSWRKRYHQLVLHDPVWYDHMPYLEFPPNWPIFTPKDKLAEWFEAYAKIMELVTWTSTTVEAAKYDDNSGQWTVKLKRVVDGKEITREIHPKHIIQATGHSGEKNFPSHIQGIADFKGDRLCHSSNFPGAPENSKGKKAVIVGCCNSAHDIAQDYYEKGYSVTMVQRSTTCVISSKDGLDVMLKGTYEEGGMHVDDADIDFMSKPTPVMKRHHIDLTKEINRLDSAIRSGLTNAGFALDNGPDNSGHFMKYIQRGGGYYIDVGASSLIGSGAIKIIQGTEIARVLPHGIRFKDGREIEADEIVFATGYKNMRSVSGGIFGKEVQERVHDVWGLDQEGEIRTLWRGSGHPGFWFMGGNLHLCRYFSRLLALQIKAREEGLMKV